MKNIIIWVLVVLALLWVWKQTKAKASGASKSGAAVGDSTKTIAAAQSAGGAVIAVPTISGGYVNFASQSALEAAYNSGAITYVDYAQGLEALGLS